MRDDVVQAGQFWTGCSEWGEWELLVISVELRLARSFTPYVGYQFRYESEIRQVVAMDFVKMLRESSAETYAGYNDKGEKETMKVDQVPRFALSQSFGA